MDSKPIQAERREKKENNREKNEENNTRGRQKEDTHI
jgi:hypothetical protein